ncbi:MAG: hypothetical protein ACSHYA_09145 [Opitutaceae bacterium]
MKKTITITLAALTALSAFAAKGDSSKQEFMATQKAKFQQKGWSWDQAKMDAMFNEMDADNNGIVSGDEKKAYWTTSKANKSSVAAKKPVEAPKPAVVKPKVALKKGDHTLEAYVAIQKKRWTEKGWNWDQSRVEDEFHAIDVNSDGVITGVERKEYWANKK